MQARATISAKFLLAAPPPTTVVIPEGFKVTRYTAKWAAGSRRPKGNAIIGSNSPKWMGLAPRQEIVRGAAARKA